MTVNPGFGGQAFIHETLPKIQQAAPGGSEKKLELRIGVDGGIDFKTAADCAHAGADTFLQRDRTCSTRSHESGVKKMEVDQNAGSSDTY